MSCSNVKIVEHKNVEILIAQYVYSLNQININNTNCSMYLFIEQNKQKLAQYTHLLSTINNEKISLLYKFSKHSFFKRYVQFFRYIF